MAEKVASLYAEIGANVQGFQQGAGQVQTGLIGMKGQFQSMGQVGVGAMDSLGLSMLRFVGPAAIGAAVVGVGKLAFALSDMREQSEMVEARFRAQVGGAAAATEAFDEMNRALGDALDRDEKMIAAGQIMGLGLADNAKDVAELAKQAAYLGDKTQSVSSRIESLTQVLVTGRTMGLREFGISTAEVNQRVDELKVAQSGLSDIEAKQIAIKEALTQRLADYIAEGGKAATTTQELNSAWRTLKDTAADRVNLEAVVTIITKITKGATVAIGPEGQTEREYERAFQNYALAVRDVEVAQRQLGQSATTWAKENAQANLEAAQAVEAEALAALQASQANQDAALNAGKYSHELDAMSGSILGVTDAIFAMNDAASGQEVITYKTPIPETFGEELERSIKALESWKQRMMELEGAQAIGVKVNPDQVLEAQRAITELGDRISELRGMSPIEIKAKADIGIAYTPQGPTAETDFWTFQQEGRIAEANRNRQRDASNEAARIQRQAADDFQRKVEAAADKLKQGVADALRETQTNVAGLAPELEPGAPGYELARLLKEGPFAPGAGGPTEQIYRVEAVAFGGNQNEWAQQLGINQEQAQAIIAQVGAGNWAAPEVQPFVDWNRLAQMVQEGGAGAEAAQTILEAAGKLEKVIPQEIIAGQAAGEPAVQTINVTVSAGAVTVTGTDATGMGELVGRTIAGALEALTTAERRSNLPPPSRAPGNR